MSRRMGTLERKKSSSSRSSRGSLKSKQAEQPQNLVEGECDFFESPTVLSRLILHQKYEAAVRRIKKAPHEVSTWVSKNRLIEDDESLPYSPRSVTSGTKESRIECSYRQLPLHMACSALSRVVDKALRRQVEGLIHRLVVSYPEACSRRDHEGRLPLHEALWQNALPDTIVTILMAYPEAAQKKDIYGKTASQLNENRRGSHKPEVAKMLGKSKTFWDFARKEAKLKLKASGNKGVSSSVDSISPLSDSKCGDDEYSIITRASIFQGRATDEYREQIKIKGPINSKKATKWSQLEERALQLEKLLADRHEENYAMAEEISRLKAFEEKYEQVTSEKYLANALVKLEKEKGDMQKQIGRMKKVLQRNGLSADDASEYSGKPLEVKVETVNSVSHVKKTNRPKEITIPSEFSGLPDENKDIRPQKEEFLEEESSSSDERKTSKRKQTEDCNKSDGTASSGSEEGPLSPATSATESSGSPVSYWEDSTESRGTRSTGSSVSSQEEDESKTSSYAKRDAGDEKMFLSSASKEIELPAQNSGEPTFSQRSCSSDEKEVSTSSSSGTKSSGDKSMNDLSRKDLERLAKEQEVVDRLRDERQYLQSLIDQLSKSSKWRKTSSRSSSGSRSSGSSGSSGRRGSRSSRSRGRTRGVNKGTSLLDYSKKISNRNGPGLQTPHDLLQSQELPRRQLLTLDDFSDPSGSSTEGSLLGELNPIKEEGSECSEKDMSNDNFSIASSRASSRKSASSGKWYNSNATMASF